MTKVIKRVGIVFFVLVISCLLITGCLLVRSLTVSEDFMNTKTESSLSASSDESNATGLVAQNADYILKGTRSQIAEEWNKAVNDSYTNKRNVKVVLESDWKAEVIDSSQFPKFGKGTGFESMSGSIYVSKGVDITLDLNGHKIDRDMFDRDISGAQGRCFWVSHGTLNILDSTYDGDKVFEMFANNTLTQANIDALPYGQIKGARNNKTGGYGGSIRVEYEGVLNFYSGIICRNTADYGAGLTAMRDGTINFYDGLIFGNVSNVYGGGVLSGIESVITMKGGIVANNKSHIGAGMFIYEKATANLRNVIISKNELESTPLTSSTAEKAGGGVYYSDAILKIGIGTQIYDNTLNGAANNVYLFDNNIINVWGRYYNPSDVIGKYSTHVGVTMKSNTGIFTNGYAANNSLAPHTFFFSDNNAYKVANAGQEIALQDNDITGTTQLNWKYGNQTTKNMHKVVTYNGQGYTVSATGNIYLNKQSKPAESFTVTDIGSYAFYSTGNYSNNVFTLTILPKQVDLIWNTNLTYNGAEQKPTAEVNGGIGDVNLSVTVSGGATNVGDNYVAMATWLNNKNYKINPSTQNTIFSIKPANLTVMASSISRNVIFNGQPIEFSPKTWYGLSANLLGQDENKTLNEIFNIDYSKIVPQFTKDGVTTDSVINVGEYAIGIKPFDVSKVFSGNSNYNVTVNYVNGGTLTVSEANVIRPTAESKYDYLILEGDKRVSYKDKGLIHGDNDSNVNVVDGKANYYMGNISPNTSVNKFISNLVYDKTQIQIYNSKGAIIYDKGNASVNAELLNNGKELAVGTGWYIEYSKDGVTERVTLSVLGDVNGDGRISASDVTYLRQIASDNALYESLSVEKKLASMVINKGNVTSADAEIVRNVVDKLLTMNLFF